MANYVKQTWIDSTTPINAQRLGHMEDGIAAAVQYTEQNLTDDQKAQARLNLGIVDNEAEYESEVLSIVRTTSYPNTTTYLYTESTTISGLGYMVVKPGNIKGGLLTVDFDTNYAQNFDFNLFMYDSDGAPYQHTYGINNVTQSGGGFQGELFEPVYVEPGGGTGGFGSLVAPFTLQIPDGCTIMANMRWSHGNNATYSPNGTITSGTTFVNWVESGGITFTVSKEKSGSSIYQAKNIGVDNANRNMITDSNGSIVPGGPAYTASVNPCIKSVNHRGFNTIAPENTISAYKLSKQMGFDIVECDIAFTSDSVPVLLHDGSIDRTSNGSGTITQMTLAEVRACDFGSWKSIKYAGEQIPTFDEFVAFCRKSGLKAYVDVRTTASRANAEMLVSIAKKYGMLDHITWISFGTTQLEYFRDLHAPARLGYVVGPVTQAVVTAASELKNDVNEVFIDACWSDNIDESQAEMCRNANIPLELWGLNTESAVLGSNHYVSGFTTDSVIAGITFYKSTL